VLYAVDLGREQTAGTSEMARAEEAFERVAAHFELPEGARVFAKELVTGVCRSRMDLDARLAAHSENWRVDRMAAVDRNVLRIGVYEVLHTDTPAAVVIDEAVELAQRFGGDRSPAFVNGILDSVAREGREGSG
jgi:N utilization substance protein B